MDQYLIVEPSNGKVVMGSAPSMYEVGEIVPDAMPELKGVMPRLYTVEHWERQLPVIKNIAARDIEKGLAPRVCALVETDADWDILMKHIGDTLALPRQWGEGYSVFRFYDPRVFSHLGWLLREDQMGRIFGPIVRWSYYSGQSWVTVHRPEAALAETLALTDRQWTVLRELPLLEQALKAIRDAGEPIDDRMPRKLEILFAKGNEFGLSRDDKVVFAVQAALVSPNIDRHPAVAAALKRQDSYAETTAKWTDEDWARIAFELPQYV